MLARGRSAGNYSPDIDGLRAIAVDAVVAFHTFPSISKGGFVGVDVSFVISRFLLSEIIVDGIEEGRFSYVGHPVFAVKQTLPSAILPVVQHTVLTS